MKFLIQHNSINVKHLHYIKDAVEKYPHAYVGMIPYSEDITCDEELTGVDYIPYGSVLLTKLAYEKYKWRGLYFDYDNFNYKTYIKNRDDMLNSTVMKAHEVAEYMTKQPSDKEFFVRPSLDLKLFSGQVLSAVEWAEWLNDAINCESLGTYAIDKDVEMIVSEPVEINAEWRWFIVDGKVISGSTYLMHNQMRVRRERDQDVIDEAQSFADKWLPNKCCVMDLALVNFDTIKVVEFNAINSSGFYNCDVKKIIDSLYEYSCR